MLVWHKILVGKPEGKRRSGRCRHEWKDNIKINNREIGCEGIDVINLVQRHILRSPLINLQVP
jgi:hypothetical protein